MGCNPACQAKVLLNGGNIVGIAKSNQKVLERMSAEDYQGLDGEKVIELLNRMEDDAVEVQKLIARGAGYSGPTGKMLND